MPALTQCVDDLGMLVDLGTKWGDAMAQAAASWDLAYDVRRRGSREMGRVLSQYELDPRLREELLELLHDRPPWDRWWSTDHPAGVLLRDRRALEIRGRAVRPRRMTYENPLELVLYGAGPLLGGVILLARLVRDWSSQRRIGAAAATTAEAEARKVQAEAARAETATDFARWMAEEARAGRAGIPQGEMLRAITPGEAKAIDRLAEREVTLSLPPGTDPDA